jgi:hypothetical protein
MSHSLPPPWHADPLEVDRHLDGEEVPAERAARAADLASDARLARRVAARGAFLAALRAPRGREASSLPPGLEARVRARLAAARSPRRLRWAAAAAALLVAVGAGVLVASREEAQALPEEIRVAVALAAQPAPGAEGRACGEGSTHPGHFPAVREEAWSVARCVEGEGEEPSTHAVLFRLTDTTRVGYVAVPQAGTREAREVGMTTVGDTIVFDVAYGRTRYYLAAPARFVAERGTCAACHGPERAGAANPHRIVERRWDR